MLDRDAHKVQSHKIEHETYEYGNPPALFFIWILVGLLMWVAWGVFAYMLGMEACVC